MMTTFLGKLSPKYGTGKSMQYQKWSRWGQKKNAFKHWQSSMFKQETWTWLGEDSLSTHDTFWWI